MDYSGISSVFGLACYNDKGELDTTFGTDGKVTTDFGSYDEAFSVTILGDKIIVAGMAENSTSIDFGLACYNENGELDTNFGTGGKVTTDFNGSDDLAFSVTTLGKKIIVAGIVGDNVTGADFGLACYNENGTLDTNFGPNKNGKVTTDFNGSYDEAYSVTTLGKKIIVAGLVVTFTGIDFGLACYNEEGELDTTFGPSKNGKVTTDFNNTNDTAFSVTILNNVADGMVTTDFGVGNDGALSVTTLGDNIIAAGYATIGSDEDFALASYKRNGELDTTFGPNGTGKVTTDFGVGNDAVNSVTILGDNIIVAGYAYASMGVDIFVLASYTSKGILDTNFGTDGLVTLPLPYPGPLRLPGEYYSVTTLGDKIIVAGFVNGIALGLPLNPFAMVCYTSNGILDTSFGSTGTDFFSGETGIENWTALSITTLDNNIIVSGFTYTDDTSRFALARYTSNGILDTSFGPNSDGMVATNFGYSSSSGATSVTTLNNNIIVAGVIRKEGDADFALARYTSNGILDTSFGTAGVVVTEFSSDFSTATSVTTLGNNIIVAGISAISDSDGQPIDADFALACYTSSGKLDKRFGPNGTGKVTTDFFGGDDWARSVTILGGDIIVAGVVDGLNGNRDFALACYYGSHNENDHVRPILSLIAQLKSNPDAFTKQQLNGILSMIAAISVQNKDNANLLVLSVGYINNLLKTK